MSSLAPAGSEASDHLSAGSRIRQAANWVLSPVKAVVKKVGSSVHMPLLELMKFSTQDLQRCFDACIDRKRAYSHCYCWCFIVWILV
jgi:hypothetical protein